MRSLNRNDFAPYTDVYTKHCPHCAVCFYTNRRRDVFHNNECYRKHYSLLQRSPVAAVMASFDFPSQRAWSLRKKEELHAYFFDVVRTCAHMEVIQDFPLIKKFRQLHGIKRIRNDRNVITQLEIFAQSKESLQEEIMEDLKKIIDYPPAFENNDRENLEFILTLLLTC